MNGMEILSLIIQIFSWASIVIGSCFMIIGSAGLLRFTDFWARLHAASVIESGGMIFFLLGMCLQASDWLIFFKLAFIGLFLFITGPTATHAVARAVLSEKSKEKSIKRGTK